MSRSPAFVSNLFLELFRIVDRVVKILDIVDSLFTIFIRQKPVVFKQRQDIRLFFIKQLNGLWQLVICEAKAAIQSLADTVNP